MARRRKERRSSVPTRANVVTIFCAAFVVICMYKCYSCFGSRTEPSEELVDTYRPCSNSEKVDLGRPSWIGQRVNEEGLIFGFLVDHQHKPSSKQAQTNKHWTSSAAIRSDHRRRHK